MVEYIDIYDENNEPTKESYTIREAHELHKIHRSSHVWILNQDNMVLLQKRSIKMFTEPGKLASSAAGHVSSGQTPDEAAVDECYEEIGIKLEESQLSEPIIYRLNIIRDKQSENEWQYIYFIKKELDISDLIFQESEVDGIELITIDKLEEDLRAEDDRYSYYEPEYIDIVIRELRELSKK